jgi:peroxiredoxin Q/BCP
MSSQLLEGTPAPAFRLPCDGGEVSLGDFRGRKLVVFFYPKADTPGCTSEAKAFSALQPAFAQIDTAIIGVSADSPKRQSAFKAKYGLVVPLASDESHEMLVAYGVWGEKSMYGRKYMGITRTTVLIDRDGRIARIWPKVKIDGHADEVLATAKAL